jgi:hypothetical protein
MLDRGSVGLGNFWNSQASGFSVSDRCESRPHCHLDSDMVCSGDRGNAVGEQDHQDVTLHTLHEDMKSGFADLKAALVVGFRGLPTRESSEEMVRLLREANRLSETSPPTSRP